MLHRLLESMSGGEISCVKNTITPSCENIHIYISLEQLTLPPDTMFRNSNGNANTTCSDNIITAYNIIILADNIYTRLSIYIESTAKF
jgi:hypothetical protein